MIQCKYFCKCHNVPQHSNNLRNDRSYLRHLRKYPWYREHTWDSTFKTLELQYRLLKFSSQVSSKIGHSNN
jgi:hypothetical protein